MLGGLFNLLVLIDNQRITIQRARNGIAKKRNIEQGIVRYKNAKRSNITHQIWWSVS